MISKGFTEALTAPKKYVLNNFGLFLFRFVLFPSLFEIQKVPRPQHLWSVYLGEEVLHNLCITCGITIITVFGRAIPVENYFCYNGRHPYI